MYAFAYDSYQVDQLIFWCISFKQDVQNSSLYCFSDKLMTYTSEVMLYADAFDSLAYKLTKHTSTFIVYLITHASHEIFVDRNKAKSSLVTYLDMV